MTNNNNKRILEEFDEKFVRVLDNKNFIDMKATLDNIKYFILKALKQQREEIVEKIENEIINYENAEAEDINCNSYEGEIRACKDIINLINKE